MRMRVVMCAPMPTRMVPATISSVPAQRCGVICSFRKKRPISALAT